MRIIDGLINEMNICISWGKYYVDFTRANEYNGVRFTSTQEPFLLELMQVSFIYQTICLTILQCIVNSKYL